MFTMLKLFNEGEDDFHICFFLSSLVDKTKHDEDSMSIYRGITGSMIPAYAAKGVDIESSRTLIFCYN
jgi:hypothetical protein